MNRPEPRVIIIGADPTAANPDAYSEVTLAQLLGAKAANRLATGQVTLPVVSSGNRLIAAARTGRISIVVANDSGNAIYVGDSAVTASNGLKVPAGQSVSIEGSAAVYAINSATSAIQLVTYMETFNA